MDGRERRTGGSRRDATFFGEPTLAERASTVEERPGDPPELGVPRTTSTSYLTHGSFRYVGKLPPPLVAFFLDRYTSVGDIVLDPSPNAPLRVSTTIPAPCRPARAAATGHAPLPPDSRGCSASGGTRGWAPRDFRYLLLRPGQRTLRD